MDSRMGSMKNKTFVLLAVPLIEDVASYLIDFLETTLNIPVHQVEVNKEIPSKALVTMSENIDLIKAAGILADAKNHFEGCPLKVEPCEQSKNVVIAQGVKIHQKLEHFFLKLYLQSQFADGNEIVTKSVEIPETDWTAAGFTDEEVMQTVLDHPDHTPLPSEGYKIQVNPFYHNFHGLIPYRGKFLSNAFEDDNRMTQEQQTHQGETKKGVEVHDSSTGKTFLMKQGQGADAHIKVKSSFGFACGPSDSRGCASPDVHSSSAGRICTKKQSQITHADSIPKPYINDPSTFDKDTFWQCNLNEAEWNLLRRKMKRSNCNLSFDKKRRVLSVSGNNVEEFVSHFQSLKSRVIKHYKLLDENMEKLLTSPFVIQYLTCNSSEAHWIVEERNILIYGFLEYPIDTLKKTLTYMQIGLEKIVIENNVPEETLPRMKDHYEKSRSVHISFDPSHITIIGLKKDLCRVTADIAKQYKAKSSLGLMDEREDSKTMFFEFSEMHHKLLMNFYKTHIVEVLKNISISTEKIPTGKVVIKLDGTKKHVEKAVASLKKIQESIQTEMIDVLKDFHPNRTSLIMDILTSLTENDPFYKFQKDFEKENKCIIVNEAQSRRSYCGHRQGPNSGIEAGGAVSDGSGVDCQEEEINFKVNSALQLTIKTHGDITNDLSDILVCLLPTNKKLTVTNVGMAFLKRIPTLQDILKTLKFSSKGVAITSEKAKGSHACKSIAFVILKRDMAAKDYEETMKELLSRAAHVGARSVCFPPLGFGRALKYPKDFVSQNFFSAVVSFSSTRDFSVRIITFLATDPDLYNEMKQNGARLFQTLSVIRNSENSIIIRIIHRGTYSLVSSWKETLNSAYETLPSSAHVWG